MARQKNAIIAEFTRILRALRAAEGDRERRTILLRDLAVEAVDLREHFLTDDGRPDWAGRTWAYRDLQRQMYVDAGYSPELARATQAAVRYHTGNIIRERIGVEEREDAGMLVASPFERARAARERREAIVRAADGLEDVLASVTTARDILANVTVARVRELAPAEAGQVHDVLTEITALVRRASRAAPRTRGA